MKTTLKCLGFALFATCLTACSSGGGGENELPEPEGTLNPSGEIKLTGSITPLTKATDLNQQTTQIATGQSVGVTITGAKSEHTNGIWKANGDGSLTNTGDILYYGDGQITVYAYHPYDSSWKGTDQSESFSVKTDQSTAAGYLSSDLLYAKKTASKSVQPVALSFSHRLSKINVTLTSEEISDLSNATVYICGTDVTACFNPFTGTLSASTAATVSDIKAAVTTTSAQTASAIIVPQTVAVGTRLIKVEHNGKTYSYILSAAQVFKSGILYNYTLAIKNTDLVEVTITSDQIVDWIDEEENKSGDATVSGSDMSWTD